MTRIIGTLKGTANDNLTGKLAVTLPPGTSLIEESITSTVPDIIHLPVVKVFNVDNGVVNFDLPESETKQITYNFKFTVEGDTTPLQDFYAKVPNKVEINYSELIPTNIAEDTRDTSLARLKKQIYNDKDIIDFLVGMYGVVYEFNPTSLYYRGNKVFYNGSGYVYINTEPTIGNYPTNNNYWQLFASKGDPGTGTRGNDAPYSPTLYRGQLDAVTMNRFSQVVETLASKDLINQYAPISNPILQGAVSVPTPPPDDNSSRAINTQYFYNYGVPKNNPELLGEARTSSPPLSSNDSRIANTKWVKDVRQIRQTVVGIANIQLDTSSKVPISSGLSLTITPSSLTSRFLILVNQNGCGKVNGSTLATHILLRLNRNSTQLTQFGFPSGYNLPSDSSWGTCGTSWIDSPSTISPITYSTDVWMNDAPGSVRVQWGSSSTITVMELDYL